MGPASKPARKTFAEWLAAPESARLELVDGELLEKAAPSIEHGFVQAKVTTRLGSRFNRKPGSRFPGGWWIASEVDLQLGTNGFRPDLCGWRRARVPVLPKGRPVVIRPDWICEIVSDSNASHDRIIKMRAYHQAGIPHYWLVDPVERTLVVMRHTEGGYLNVLAATAEETVRPEPFEALELRLSDFFEDEADDAPSDP